MRMYRERAVQHIVRHWRMRSLFIVSSMTSMVLATVWLFGTRTVDPAPLSDPIEVLFILCAIGCVTSWICAVICGIAYRAGSSNTRELEYGNMYCRSCHYMLVGLPENRCPDCGRLFDPDKPSTFLWHPKQSSQQWWVIASWFWVLCCGMLIGGFMVVLLVMMAV